MGYSSTIYISSDINMKEIFNFLRILDYNEIDDKYFYYNKKYEYKYLSGVTMNISEEDNKIKIFGRTQIFGSKYDLKFHNFTIKQIVKHFDANFTTDSGVNKYFIHNNLPDRIKAEAGCYLAYFDLHDIFTTAKMYLKLIKDSDTFDPFPTKLIPEADPNILGVNLLLPYIVSIIEEYFRDLYVALLRYSNRKEKIIKNVRPYNEYLIKVSNNEIIIEEAIARSHSFQNIDKIHSYFREINSNLDIKGYLKKPYEKSDEKLLEVIKRIIETRHELVHSRLLSFDYDYSKIKEDLDYVQIALERIYYHLVEEYNWSDQGIDWSEGVIPETVRE